MQTFLLLGAVVGLSFVVALEPDIQPTIVTSVIPGAYIVELADAVVSVPSNIRRSG